jgi:putative FmdB family regulatory protein
MPLYEYQCEKCHQEFEQIVRYSEADLLPACPTCGSQQTHKKISAAASISNSPAPSFTSSGSSCSTGSCCSSGTCGF